MTQRRYTYDLRINTTITVEAGSPAEAWRLANEKLEGLELIVHPNGETLDLDLEDGLEALLVEDIE